MSNSLVYKGYQGVVEFSADDNLFVGKIFGIHDLVTFEGNSIKQLEKSFQEAVEDYLATCMAVNKNPERPYKGTFNVRINPEIHRKAALKAQSLNISLNELVEKAITKEVRKVKIAPAQPLPQRREGVTQKKKRSVIQKKLNIIGSGKRSHKLSSETKKK